MEIMDDDTKKEPQMDTTMADEVRQQPAATMYSLEQVEKAIRDELEKNHKWLDMHTPAFIDAVRARLTARQQQPTEQEIVTTVLEKWADGYDADGTNELFPQRSSSQDTGRARKERQVMDINDTKLVQQEGKYTLSTSIIHSWLEICDTENMYAVVSVQASLPHAKEIIEFAWEKITKKASDGVGGIAGTGIPKQEPK